VLATRADELRAKHRLSKFLLRQGIQPPPGMRNWSERHQQWLNRTHFEQLADRVVFGDYLAEVCAAGQPAAGDCRSSGHPRHRFPDRGDDRS
jgi:hypothetical protein